MTTQASSSADPGPTARTPVGSSGANGPFISVAGPVLDANGKPVGFEFAMSNAAIGSPISRELCVICADVSQ
jgi:hypothetical protein